MNVQVYPIVMSHAFTASGSIRSSHQQSCYCFGKGSSPGLPVRNLFGHPKKNGSLYNCEVFNNVRGGARRFCSTSRQSVAAQLGSLSTNSQITKNRNTMHTECTVAHERRIIFRAVRSKGGECYAALN